METGEGDDSGNPGRQVRSSTIAEEQREIQKRKSSVNGWPFIGDWCLIGMNTIYHFCYDGTFHVLDESHCIYCGERIPDGIKAALNMIRS